MMRLKKYDLKKLKNLTGLGDLSGFLILLLFLSACTKDQPEIPIKDTYAFLGHTYDWNSNGRRADPRIEQLPFDTYKGIMLGGDVCAEVTRDIETVAYIDAVFDLSNPLTFYALGNHDTRNGNLHYITNATQRRDFYVHYHDETVFMVLNCSYNHVDSLWAKCDAMQEQLDMILTTLDTMTSPNLFMLMHQVVWGYSEPDMDTQTHANDERSVHKFLCGNDTMSRFDMAIYPELKELRARGTDIYVISGDGGQRSKKYHYESPDGINFFISGINNSLNPDDTPPNLLPVVNFNPDSILLFQQDEIELSFDWKFVPL